MSGSTTVSLLEELGLTNKEARVYYAILSLGSTTILRVARSTGIKRTTIYSVIESLKHKGLVALEVRGFKQRFVAEDPRKLEGMLAEKKAKLEHTMPELSGLFNLKGGESTIKYYEGESVISSLYSQLLEDVRPGDDYLVLSNVEEWWKLDKNFLQDFTMKRGELARAHNISIRLLLEDTQAAREYKKNDAQYHTHTKILPPNTKLTTNLVIIPQKTLIHQLVPPVVAMVIENASVVQMHREMFEIMWESM